jgi:phage protein D
MQVTYVCIGTSSVLNSSATRKWEQVSPTYIAARIAAEKSLRSVTTPSGYTLDYEVQVGESNFTFLNRIADKTGMRFWCSGGTLYMLSATAALEGSGQSAVPSYNVDKSLSVQDTCRDFKYLSGKNLPGSVQATRAIYGIDASSNRLFSASATPGATSDRVAVKTTYATQSYADAKQRVNAWSTMSQFYTGATATLYGNTELYPGKLIQLTGAALPDGASGYWLISMATHNMSRGQTTLATQDRYLTDVTMLRNAVQSNIVLSNITPVTPEFTRMNLNSHSTWVSQNLSAVQIS